MLHKRRLSFALFMLVGIGGCQRSKPVQPVVVRVLYDQSAPYAPRMGNALASFSQRQESLTGKPVIAAFYSGEYSKALDNNQHILHGMQLVVVEPGAAAQAAQLKDQLDSTVTLCAEKECRTAGIPKWVTGVDREAAGKLLSFLAREMPSKS